MILTEKERRFLTALSREQDQNGCRGPAHDLLRKNVYPDVPRTGPDSLAFAYAAIPLTSLLLKEYTDLEQIDDFLRKGERFPDVEWPWASPDEYRERLEQAQQEWSSGQEQLITRT